MKRSEGIKKPDTPQFTRIVSRALIFPFPLSGLFMATKNFELVSTFEFQSNLVIAFPQFPFSFSIFWRPSERIEYNI